MKNPSKNTIEKVVLRERLKISGIWEKYGKAELNSQDEIAYYSALEQINIYRKRDITSPKARLVYYAHRSKVAANVSTRLILGIEDIFSNN